MGLLSSNTSVSQNGNIEVVLLYHVINRCNYYKTLTIMSREKNEQPFDLPLPQSDCIAKKVTLLLLRYFWDFSIAVDILQQF